MAEGQSRFTLRADNAQYDSAMSKSEKATRDVEKSQKDMGKGASKSSTGVSALSTAISSGREKLNQYAIVAAAAGVAMTAAFVKNGLATADALAKTSDKLGIATEKLVGLRYAAELSGAGSATLDKGLEKLNIRMAEAAAGGGTAAKSFETLNIKATDLVNLSPDQAMYRVADALSGVENSAQKTKIAYDIFGKSGTSLINTLAGGSKGLQELQDEAEAAGLALTRIDARKIEIANDNIIRAKEQLTGFSQQLAVKFAPLLSDIAERMFGVGTEAGGMAKVAGKSFDYMVKAAGVFANGIHALEIGWVSMKLVFQESAKFIIGGLDKLAAGAVDMYNSLPWVDDAEYTSLFSGFLATMDSEIAASRSKIEALLSQRLPSDRIEAWVDDTTRAFEAQAAAIQESQGEVQGEIITTEQVTKALGTAAKETATKTKESAKEVETAWDEALQGMAERIDTGFSSAWRAALDGDAEYFKSDFLGDMLDATKEFAAELLHLNITRPLVTQVGAAFGLGAIPGVASAAGGASGAVSAAGGASSLLSGGGSLWSILSGGVSGAGMSAYNALSRFSSPLAFGIQDYGSQAIQYLGGEGLTTGTNFLAGGALNLGAGLAGGYIGNKVFGDTSGLGSTLGGAAGTYFGAGNPVFTALGSALGAGLEKGISKIFGIGGTGNNAAAADFNLATGLINSRTWGNNKSDPQNVTASLELAQSLSAVAAAIGGSSFSGSVEVGSKRGISLNGQKYSDTASFMDAAFIGIVEGAEHLSESLKRLILDFNGTSDEMLVFAQSMISIESAIQNNPVEQALADFSAAQEAAGRTLLDSYESQLQGLSSLVRGFDGSAQSAAQLSVAIAENRDASYNLAIAYKSISQSLSDVVGNTAQQIRESVLTDEERLAAWQAERTELRAQTGHILDPQELEQNVLRINELTQSIFNNFSEEQQKLRAPDFVSYLEELAAVQERQNERGYEIARQSQEALAATITDALNGPADKFGDAAEMMASVLQQFLNRLSTGTVAESGRLVLA